MDVFCPCFLNNFFGRAITIWVAIEKRSSEPIYKPDTESAAKGLRAITFAIAKLLE